MQQTIREELKEENNGKKKNEERIRLTKENKSIKQTRRLRGVANEEKKTRNTKKRSKDRKMKIRKRKTGMRPQKDRHIPAGGGEAPHT